MGRCPKPCKGFHPLTLVFFLFRTGKEKIKIRGCISFTIKTESIKFKTIQSLKPELSSGFLIVPGLLTLRRS